MYLTQVCAFCVKTVKNQKRKYKALEYPYIINGKEVNRGNYMIDQLRVKEGGRELKRMEMRSTLCFRQSRMIYELNTGIRAIERGYFVVGQGNRVPSFLLPVACLIQG